MRILVCFPFVASEKGSVGGPTETVSESKQQVMAAPVDLPGIGGSGGRMFRLSHVKAGLRAGSSLKRMQHGPWWCYSSADWGDSTSQKRSSDVNWSDTILLISCFGSDATVTSKRTKANF